MIGSELINKNNMPTSDSLCIPCIGAERKEATFIKEVYKKQAIKDTGNKNINFTLARAMRELITKEYNLLK